MQTAPPASAAPSVASSLARASHLPPTLAVTAGSTGLAVAADAPASTTILLAAAVLAGQLTIGWSNDLVDHERDVAAARTDKPLAADAALLPVVRRAVVVAAVACVVLSLACGLWAGLLHLLLVASGWAYNLRLKATPVSWVPYAFSFGGLPVFAGLSRGADLLPWWVALTAALLGVGAHFVNVVPDLDDDAAAGVRGLPHRLGARGSVWTACALLAAASAVVLVAARATLGLAAWVAALVVLGFVVAAVAGRGKTPFRAAIGIALVDVIVLVWAL